MVYTVSTFNGAKIIEIFFVAAGRGRGSFMNFHPANRVYHPAGLAKVNTVLRQCMPGPAVKGLRGNLPEEFPVGFDHPIKQPLPPRSMIQVAIHIERLFADFGAKINRLISIPPSIPAHVTSNRKIRCPKTSLHQEYFTFLQTSELREQSLVEERAIV